jgi:hypothetical protein
MKVPPQKAAIMKSFRWVVNMGEPPANGIAGPFA